MKKVILLLVALSAAACATTPDVIDPYEKTNRKIFEFNRKVDRVILDPVANTYNAVMPSPARKGIRNAFDNLSEPMTFANDILQAKPERAISTLARFIINSTVGIAGLWNPAEKMGLKRHKEDIGQTLAVWGFKESPYFIIPFVGPSTTRDTVGFTASLFLDPTDYVIDKEFGWEWVYARLGADIITIRAELDKVLDDLYSETDPYLLARSAYLQRRDYLIRDGREKEYDEEDDLFFDDELDDEEVELLNLILSSKNQ
ncbi:VacJ family lipoprotein [Temperatibacter marinus]|uniref:VacJ family lipoprotein n=1 Tax=Temperatibacter marinus TaxID=1456591 RepID=A0AA52EE91_9PROT|nr:VacJ family lipoprotein [Temperatibacter marinus]WND02068.1 VacJ family lipoprotein [Temperatibacter marinus]